MKANLIPSHSSPQEKDQFLALWKSSKTVRDRLVTIFTNKLEALLKDDEDVESFADPQWQLKQAYNLGRRQAIRDFIDYLRQEA